jgi:uncharacterized membrane protein
MPPIQHIHPILVHFPIVFFLTLAALDAVAAARGRVMTGRGALGSVSSGLAALAGGFAIVTYIFGGFALDVAESGGFHSDIAETHEGLGEFTAIAFAVWAAIRVFLWWRDVRLNRAASALIPLVEIAGAVLVVVTAYYGGQLVYDLGVNVAHAAG